MKSPMITTLIDEPEAHNLLAARHPWNSLGRPEDIADAALFLCSGES